MKFDRLIKLLLCFWSTGICNIAFSSVVQIDNAIAPQLGDTILRHIESPDAHELRLACANATQDLQERLDAIMRIPDAQRTFANTLKPLDELLEASDAALLTNCCQCLEFAAPTPDVKKAANEMRIYLKELFIGSIDHNEGLYHAVRAVASKKSVVDELMQEEQYFLSNILLRFQRAGLDQPEAVRGRILQIKKQLVELDLQYGSNMSGDSSLVTLSADELGGIPQHVYADRWTQDRLHVSLKLDYPTYFTVIGTATDAAVRKRMYQAFARRAYPENDTILRKLINLRHELADLLGYRSYAEFELAEQMAGSVDAVKDFLGQVEHAIIQRCYGECEKFAEVVDDSIELVDGLFLPWDLAYLKQRYLKMVVGFDQQVVAEYFPIEQSIASLLEIYNELFSITFVRESLPTWHPDVVVYGLYGLDQSLLGYVYLDLYPRAGKYTHACCYPLVPACFEIDGSPTISRAYMMANLPQPKPGYPGLLSLQELSTFFHELGHALHIILGRTALVSQSGALVKTDFVEFPSMMLEYWLHDKEVLAHIGRHYKTNRPLSEALLESILQRNAIEQSFLLNRLIVRAHQSLETYGAGPTADPYNIEQGVYTRYLPFQAIDLEARQYASFFHLAHQYYSKCYCYLWSLVLSYDLFKQFKQHGLTNRTIGSKYRDIVIGCGGSRDPHVLLHDFLGRKVTSETFLMTL